MNKLSELLKFLQRSSDQKLMDFREVQTKADLTSLIIILIIFQLLSAILFRSYANFLIGSLVMLAIWILFSLIVLKRPKYLLRLVTPAFITSFLFIIFGRRQFFDEISTDSVLLLGYTWGMMNNTLVDSFIKGKQITALEGGLFIIRMASLSNLSPEIATFHFLAVVGIWVARIYLSKYKSVMEKNSLIKPPAKPNQNREDLLKFKNLLNHHLPSGLIVLSEDLNKCLFTNHSFRSNLFELGQDGDDDVKNILTKMHVDPEEQRIKDALFVIPSVNFNSSQKIYTLSELISSRIKSKRLSEANTLNTSCTYKFEDDGKKEGTFDVRVFPLDWDGEKAIGIVFQDVSYQAELLSLNLANENKEKAIGIVAHELRNPISGMLGIVKVMEKMFNDQLMNEYIVTLKNNIGLLLSVLNSILDIKQLNAGKLNLNIDAVSIKDVLKNVKSLFSFQCTEKKLEFNLEISHKVSDIIYTDKERLSQILINLTSNALKFTQQGSITISVDEYPEMTQRLLFSVKDTGIGIKDENINKLFKIFGKIEDSYEMNKQGVGLGLVISNNLIKVLNRNEEDAFISVKSELGEGTTFSFFLSKIFGEGVHSSANNRPFDSARLAEERYEENVSLKSLQINQPKRFLSDVKIRAQETTHITTREVMSSLKSMLSVNEFVLLVDDISFNLYIFKNLFEDLGIQCKKALNGQEAVDQFIGSMKNGQHVVMIFMDLEMPIMGGCEASKRINSEILNLGINYKIPIVAVSGSDSESVKNSCQEAGMSEFLVKPISEETIMSLLRKYSIIK